MRKYRAALLGYYGFGNLGDELLLEACLKILISSGINISKIIVLSNNPEETSRRFNVPSVSRWNYRELVKVFRNSDSLLLGGGGIFQDSTSIKSCIWYWGIMRLAKILGCKLYALGQSIGPLSSGISKYLAGNALRLCDYIHVRDYNSFNLAEALGCGNVISGCDLVMSLKPEAFQRRGDAMLINLRPCRELEDFVKIIKPYIKSYKGRVIGAALSSDDEEAIKSLGLNEIVRVNNFQEAQKLWESASCAVGMRLHFGVLSRIFRTPAAMMPYDIKVSEFAKQSGIPRIIDEWLEPVMPLPVPDSVYSEIPAL